MRPVITLTTVACALPLAACGSSSSSSSSVGANPNYQKGLQFAACVRSHGVPNFPDPTAQSNGAMRLEANNGVFKVDGVTVNGPAFRSAQQACRAYLPNGGNPRQVSAAQRGAMLQFSQCMRSHGLSSFPDPQFSGGGARLRLTPGDGLNPQSPTFKAAQTACAPIVRKALGGAPGG